MRNRLLGAASAAALLLLAAHAHADGYPVKDGSGATQTFGSKLVSGVQYPEHINFGLNAGSPIALSVDGTGNLNVNVVGGISAGGATAANQSTEISTLGTIATNTGPVDSRSLTGVNLTAADIASTSVAGQGGVSLISGTPTANSTAAWTLTGQSSAAITISGTFVATAAIETSADGGVTWAAATGKILGSAITSGSVTGPGVFRVDLTGMTNIRLRVTAFTSGTITAKLVTSNSAGLSQVLNPVRLLGVDGVNAASATNPAPTASTYGASGVSPVTQAFTATGQTATFTPVAGRPFNVSGWGTFVATYQLERSFDSGTTWLPLTIAGSQSYVWTAPASEIAQDTEVGVQYRVHVTAYTSGTLNVRVSQ